MVSWTPKRKIITKIAVGFLVAAGLAWGAFMSMATCIYSIIEAIAKYVLLPAPFSSHLFWSSIVCTLLILTFIFKINYPLRWPWAPLQSDAESAPMKRNDSIALEVQLLAGLGVALLWWVWGFYDQACVVATYSAPTPFCSFVDKHAKGFLPLLAPLVSAPTLLFWWLRRDKHRRADLRHQSTRLLTERFSQAVELLGHSDESVRQGAIYALERLAWDSPEHHWTVMETLAAYVRNHAPIAPTKTALAPTRTALAPMTTDVQAALTALGRRKKEHREAEKVSEGCRINLSRCDLRGADLSRHGDKGMDGHFKCAEFAGSLLNEANMRGIDLAKADLRGARLENATLIGAVMNEANLEEACLDKSNLCGADLDMAKLDSAHLQNAKYNSTTIFPNTWGNNTKTQASAAKSRGMIRLD